MSSPMFDMLNNAKNEFRISQDRLKAAREDNARASCTVTSKDHAVAVTIDGQGVVTSVTFPTTKYRKMAPGELGALIVTTIAAARAEAMEKAIQTFGPILPAGLNLRGLMEGTHNMDAMYADLLKVADEMLPDQHWQK
jgi:DNA-binding protein YbaB